jgi:hypothetical protein
VTPTPPHALFPPPWSIEEIDACCIVRDAIGQALGYFYFEDGPGRRSADVRFEATAVIGCVSRETARSRMTQRGSGVCIAALKEKVNSRFGELQFCCVAWRSTEGRSREAESESAVDCC